MSVYRTIGPLVSGSSCKTFVAIWNQTAMPKNPTSYIENLNLMYIIYLVLNTVETLCPHSVSY